MNAVYLNEAEGAALLGTTKLFGNPDVTDEFEWPSIIDEDDIYDLTFMGQINLRELAEICPDNPLPKTGMLYFFHDYDAMAFSPFDKTAARVLYCGTDRNLEELCLQDEDGNDLSNPPRKLSFANEGENSCHKLFGLPAGYEAADYPRPIEGWVMLMQISTTEDAKFENGGSLCFFVEADKLAKADFSDVRVMIVPNTK